MKLLGSDSLASLLGAILTVVCFMVWFAIAAFVVLTFVDKGPSSFGFPVQFTRGLVVETEGPAGTWKIEAVVAQVTTPPREHGWLATLVAVPFMALIALVLGQLRAIFFSLRDGSPFIAKNARRLRRIGLGVLLFEALRMVVTITLIGPALESLHPLAEGVRIQVDATPSFSILFLGFAVLVLAEVFRRGTLMLDEQALTV